MEARLVTIHVCKCNHDQTDHVDYGDDEDADFHECMDCDECKQYIFDYEEVVEEE